MKMVMGFFIIYCFIVTSVNAEPSIDIYKRCYFDVASHFDKSVNGFDMALTELSSKYHRDMAQNLDDKQLKEIASSEVTRLNYLFCSVQLKEQDYKHLVSQLTTGYAERLK
ncbi:hypothetical protein [Vibrio mediterranei]|uniref:hypothetical protein n=1 Tax=Vibrio mediterranei TaxID=689 RepID=UPI001EFD02D3|nr:hypothetical protein [Vibrio mediterranei]MCG9659577.1 hypothetical protein [Vibrio mediterranei]